MTEPVAGPEGTTALRFRLEVDDYVVLSEALAARSTGRRLLEVALYAAIVAAVLFAYGGDIATIPALLLAILGAGAVLTFLHGPIIRTIARFTYRRNPAAGQSMGIRVDGEGLELELPATRSRIAWSVFSRLIERPRHAILVISRREGIVIPRRAFDSDAAFGTLLARLRDRLAAQAGRPV